ncbi:dsDNA nuclease domain-containing protein [Aquimarina litoralis]|uniref:dsDNA nuclease domain-containing protein n=1 Tax=Aquimarina litoralis TaxID=584605 RepID=UPI001C590434|nr:dsDNA nuclease domain-containing protein [Aquimarina litoralis]MBW1297781.1 DUF4297 domain-containing protein [Aquimarina litoralis]
MNLSKLHIFSKNTDAHASQRGYNYQTLCTLEVWVKNLLNNVEEEIFCEFEEDVFQRNLEKENLKFKQIKLYSSNFSFKSDEVKKCIIHFFMLHIKLDYKSFDKEYVFETNTGIAKEYSGNDASLLKEWFKNQNNPSEDQLDRFSTKIKEIIADYIGKEKLKVKNADSGEIKEAINVFENLDDNFWYEFSKSIRWNFLESDPSTEFAKVKERIESDLYELPYEINPDNITSFFGILLEYVFQRTAQDNPKNRRLTNQKLVSLILNEKDEDDKWYTRRFSYYENVESIDEFRIGEFYEIIDLVNYCRRKKYLARDKDKWETLLSCYTDNPLIDKIFRRKGIYELVYLNAFIYEVDYDDFRNTELTTGNFKGIEDQIRYYLDDIENILDSSELENVLNILNIIFPQIIEENNNISKDELKKWYVNFLYVINKRLESPKDINEKCHLLEIKANYFITRSISNPKEENQFIEYFNEIEKNIEKAPLYNVTQLGQRINKMIKMFINIDPDDKRGVVKLLELFLEKISPFIEKRNGKIALAKQQVDRGASYLMQTNKFFLLKAIEYFHKAKDNYFQENTLEGYVLGMLNIAQFYNSIGMNYAAKYYALGAFRISVNEALVKRIEDSLALLFYSDFKQGNWFDAISIYKKFVIARDSSNQTEFNKENKIYRDLCLIFYFMTNMSNQYKYFVDDFILQSNDIGTEIIKPSILMLEDKVNDLDNPLKFIEEKIDDFPLNDVGAKRIISFNALGSLWEMNFDNEYIITSIVEEFISMVQITLVEISLTEIDFHLIKSHIEIELIVSDKIKTPVQVPSNDKIKWKVFLKFFDNSDSEKIEKHVAETTACIMWVLNKISLLKEEEFIELYGEFIESRSLGSKQINVNLYQRIYRDIYSEDEFQEFKKQSFYKEDFGLSLPNENEVMKWRHELSKKYNQEKALEAIKNRFNNTDKSIYLTLSDLKQNPEFPDFINNLRQKGWKDWQIILSIFNFIVGYKANKFETNELGSSKVSFESFQKRFKKYADMDEKDCYVYFPLEAFKSEEFNFQLDVSITSILESYGLGNKLKIPNFGVIKGFLDIRFNLSVDDYNENNPLREIKSTI